MIIEVAARDGRSIRGRGGEAFSAWMGETSIKRGVPRERLPDPEAIMKKYHMSLNRLILARTCINKLASAYEQT